MVTFVPSLFPSFFVAEPVGTSDWKERASRRARWLCLSSLPAPAGPPGEGLRLLAFTSRASVDFRFSATTSVLTTVTSPEPVWPARSTAAASVDTPQASALKHCAITNVWEGSGVSSLGSRPLKIRIGAKSCYLFGGLEPATVRQLSRPEKQRS